MNAKQLIDQVIYGGDADTVVEAFTVDFSSKSKDELESMKQMYLDVIDTKKANGKEVPQEWLNRLQQINDILSGDKPTEGIATNLVFGHPQATNFPKYAHLVPIKVKDKETVERYIDRAQKEYDKLSKKLGKQEAIVKGYIKAPWAAKRKAKQFLNSMEYTELSTYRDLLRDETLKELNRVYKLLDNI